MKIISKYKDYYDYLQGVWGVDEKLILNRTEGDAKPSLPNGKNILVICGLIMEFYVFKNVIYMNEELNKINTKKGKWSSWWGVEPIYTIHLNNDSEIKHYWNHDKIHYPLLSKDVYNIYPELDEHYKNVPIFLFNHNTKKIFSIFPCLKELGINKHLKAEELWLMLSEWLSNRITEKEPIVPVGDDKTRIMAAGFDLKTSFRKM
jgi:hypothetical protein